MNPVSRPSQDPMSAGADSLGTGRGIPEATVARLPVYLRALHALSARSVATVSSENLASAAGVNSAKLRKDLSHLGSYGTRGVGYDVEYLVYQISRELGLTQDWSVAIIGVGNLGRALANYGGFASRGFRIAALLDADPGMAGERIAGLAVESVDALETVTAERHISIGVIATPAGSAQSVCDRLADAGVTSVLNFAPVVLGVPPGVHVSKVDLSIELQILAFHEQRKEGSPVLDARQLDTFAPSPAGGTAQADGGPARRAEDAHAGQRQQAESTECQWAARELPGGQGPRRSDDAEAVEA